MHYLPPEQLAEVRSVTLRASLTRTLHAHLLLDHMRLAEEETAVLFTCSNMLVPPLHLAALVPRLAPRRDRPRVKIARRCAGGRCGCAGRSRGWRYCEVAT